ncbi:GNAT family N-acetyltransferase [Agrococcus casei]|uniref:GNAT family N-acetyltransferase n=1 Tax=Agrococcus casei TaxID=343512 RepID=UPI003F8F63B3
MRFRPLAEADIAMAAGWSDDLGLRVDRWRDAHTRSAVAVDAGDRVVAVGMMWTSRMHGNAYWLDVAVVPDRRREGLGTTMVHHLASLRHENLPLKNRGFEGDVGLAFADALGARTVQVVPPFTVSVSRRHSLSALGQHWRGSLVSASALSVQDVETANAETYEWTHEHWSPVGPGFASAVNDGLWEDLNIEATVFALDEAGQIAASAMVYAEDERPLIVTETTSREQQLGEAAVAACVHEALSRLAARGVDEIDFDGHVSDPHFMPALARLSPTGRWFRLFELVPDEAIRRTV